VNAVRISYHRWGTMVRWTALEERTGQALAIRHAKDLPSAQRAAAKWALAYGKKHGLTMTKIVKERQ
jgi:hypothetical protein